MKKELKRKIHLEYYQKCMKAGGYLLKVYQDKHVRGDTYYGLCMAATNGAIDRALLEMFTPSRRESWTLETEGTDSIYWGSGKDDPEYGKFTPLRQTIVLFMAAWEGEL